MHDSERSGQIAAVCCSLIFVFILFFGMYQIGRSVGHKEGVESVYAEVVK